MLVPAVTLLLRGWQRRWLADDGLIHLRVAEQVLRGHGLVFNAGERVEASTSPLWVAVLALARMTRLLGLETAAVLIGLVSTTTGVLLAACGARLLWRREGTSAKATVLPVGATILAVLPPMWDFATSGLETGFLFLWLGSCFLLLAKLAAGDRPRWPQVRLAAVVAGLGPLIRPDLALFTGVFLLAVLFCASKVAHRPRRQLTALLALALAVPCGYQLFRMGYYGALVPSTAMAKEASRAWWSQGWHYLVDLVGTYWLWLPLSVVLVLLATEARRRFGPGSAARLMIAAAPLAGGTAHVLYVTRVGGDFMHGRLLLPGLFAVLMPVAVIEVRGWMRWGAAAVVASWAVICFFHLRVPYLVGPNGITDERAFYTRIAQRPNPVHADAYARSSLHVDGIAARQLGRLGPGLLWWRADRELPRYASVALRPDVPFHSGYVAGNLGITGIVAGTQVHIVDPSGLADPIAARLRLRVRGRPGHEKQLNLAWIVARFADPRVSIPEGTSAPAVETARRALSCGRLPEVEAAATRRLTIARFLHNIGVSWRLRSFRLDPDPAVATAQLCGRRSPRGTVGMDGGTGVPPADHPPTGGRRHRRPVAR